MSQRSFPSSAGTVIIGAGIAGSSLAYHLAKLGREDVLIVDKGPLPDPGGSTGHASSFLFPVEHTKEKTALTRESIEQYKELGTFTESGGISVARTDERVEQLKRKLGSAKNWNEQAKLLSPAEVQQLVPYLEKDVIKAGTHFPQAGTCDPLQAGDIMRQRAQDACALTVKANTEVTDIRVRDGMVQGVETDRGTVETDEVVIAAGLWGPKLAEMAGAFMPLMPAVHQLISVGPIPLFEQHEGEISYPIVRDMDTKMYERPHGNDMELGSYNHRSILWDVNDILSNDEAPLSPTQPPLTEEEFDQAMADALELMPDILDDESTGIRHSIDGLLSGTPDGRALLGPMHDVDGLWSFTKILIKEAPAYAENLAQWMTRGYPDIDLHAANVNRFMEYGESKSFVRKRVSERRENLYEIVHPGEQWDSARNLRRSPFHSQTGQLGARFFEVDGWEYPQWFESNESLLDEYSERIDPLRRPNEWDSDWWSPIILAEHLAMRDGVGIADLSPFLEYDVVGSDALAYLQKLVVAEMDVDVGRAVYTPILYPSGGVRGDMMIVRVAEDRFRLIGGGGPQKAWFEEQLPRDDSVRMVDLNSTLCTVGVWGPDARDLLGTVTDRDLDTESFPPYTAREITVGEVDAWALRVSYVGELGWEIYAPMEKGGRLWDILWDAGDEHGAVPVGWGVYAETGRMEKGFRTFPGDLKFEYDPVESGIAHHSVKNADFVGKESYRRAKSGEPAARLCTLTVDDHESPDGERRFMLGNESILTPDGDPIVDEKGRRSYVTSAGTGPSVGKHILYAYLPPEYASVDTDLSVEYFGDRYPVTVEGVDNPALFDPEHERMKQ